MIIVEVVHIFKISIANAVIGRNSASNSDMLVETFDNSMEEDEKFVAEIDEECKIEENWPFCKAGKYMMDPSIDCYLIGTCP